MPSVSRHTSRLGVLAVSAALLVGALAGCTTTQEKAAKHQAESKRILEAREQRQKRKKQGKSEQAHKDGSEQK